MSTHAEKLNSLQSKIKEIHPAVQNHATPPEQYNSSSSLSKSLSFVKNNWFYIAVPVIVTGILVWLKPWFLMKKQTQEEINRKEKPTLDWIRLIISVIVISAALIIGLYVYGYKQN